MAEVGLTFSTGVPTTVGALEIDALLSEMTNLAAKATEYAVEEGSPISDHVVPSPERLKVSGWITPSNVQLMQADGRPKMIEAKATLRKMIADRAEVTIVTGMDTYSGMILETCDIGRTNEGEHFTVDMEFVKIRKAVLRKADIPPDKTKGTATGKAGSTNTKAGKASTSTADQPSAPAQSKLKELVTRP
jgi:hypothetical protein